MHDRMTTLERVALTSAVSGAVFNVFLFAIGAQLDTIEPATPLFYARIIAGMLQAVAFDLVVVATVNGMRAGRRSRASIVTSWSAAIVSALIALDVAGVWHQPWMHASYPLIVLAFTLHLFAPRVGTLSHRPAQLRRLVRSLIGTVRRDRATADQLAAQLRHALDRVRQLEAQPRHTETVEVVVIGAERYSLRDLSRMTEIPLTTLRRRLAQIDAPEEA